MADGLPAALTLLLPTDMAFVRPGRKMIEALLLGQGWEEEDVEDVALVVTELIQNAIEHGSRADGSERADVHIHLQDGAVLIEVIDPGTGRDPEDLLERDVTTPIPPDAPRGRGLFLIHRLSTRLERERATGGGCRVRVRMEISGS